MPVDYKAALPRVHDFMGKKASSPALDVSGLSLTELCKFVSANYGLHMWHETRGKINGRLDFFRRLVNATNAAYESAVTYGTAETFHAYHAFMNHKIDAFNPAEYAEGMTEVAHYATLFVVEQLKWSLVNGSNSPHLTLYHVNQAARDLEAA
jgi:hypothetical protein